VITTEREGVASRPRPDRGERDHRQELDRRHRAQREAVDRLVRGLQEVVECHRITGEDCYLIKAHVRDVTHLEELIDQLGPYGQTTTSIMQSSPVPPRGISLRGD
jgi:DNA-binding Lrp family transcriptional regulator